MKRLLFSLFFLLGLGLVAACGSGPSITLKLAPVESLPPAMQTASQYTQEAYQFAAANPGALKNVPCTCGCKSLGHMNNQACYIKGMNPDGTIMFDQHALGCAICTDITHDVMRMTMQGKTFTQIRSYISHQYGD